MSDNLAASVTRWLVGQPFRLRSPLDEQECRRRIGLYSSGAFTPPVTADPVAVCKGNRVYLWMPFQRRGPWLKAKLQTYGSQTELVGRSGADFVTLIGSATLEVVFVWWLLTGDARDPFAWLLLGAPVLMFLLQRKSPHGEQLIDFLKQLLEAEDMLERKGDPILQL
jgi:hypothetical protein